MANGSGVYAPAVMPRAGVAMPWGGGGAPPAATGQWSADGRDEATADGSAPGGGVICECHLDMQCLGPGPVPKGCVVIGKVMTPLRCDTGVAACPLAFGQG